VTPRLARLDADAHAAELVLAAMGGGSRSPPGGRPSDRAAAAPRGGWRYRGGRDPAHRAGRGGQREQVPQVCAMVEVFANDADPVAAMAAAWKLMDRNEAGWMKQFGTKESPVSDVMGWQSAWRRCSRWSRPAVTQGSRPAAPGHLGAASDGETRVSGRDRWGRLSGEGRHGRQASGGGLGVTTAALLYEYAAEREAMEGRDAPVWVPGGNRLEMRRRMLGGRRWPSRHGARLGE